MSANEPIVLTDSEVSDNDHSLIDSNNENNANADERRIQRGMLVLVNAIEVFGEWNCTRNNIEEVYGITEYIEDKCELTGKLAWHVNYQIGPYKMVIDDLEPMMAVSEDDMVLVKHTTDELKLDDPVFIRLYFNQKENGEWEKKEPFVRKCEFCEGFNCDRVIYAGGLQEIVEDELQLGDHHATNLQRKACYKEYIRQKYGSLGRHKRKKIQVCVVDLIRSYFPVEEGTVAMGYHQE